MRRYGAMFKTLRFESPVRTRGNKKAGTSPYLPDDSGGELGIPALPSAALKGFVASLLTPWQATGLPRPCGSNPRAFPGNEKSPMTGARSILAESWGFEPQIGSLLYSLSRRAPSASRSALRDVVLTNHTPTDGLLQHKLIEELPSSPQCQRDAAQRSPTRSDRAASAA